MRIRTIKPDFFKHDRLGALPPLARLCFVGLWCMADGEGRLEDRPTRIRVEILPYDLDANVDDLLEALAVGGHIVRYEAGGNRLIQIPSWFDHQRISGKEAQTPSRFPPPTYESGSNGEATVKLEMPRKGREWNGKDRRRSTVSCGEPADAGESPPPLVAFPLFDCVPGRRSRLKTWLLTDSHLAELVATFPGVDVPKECRKAWGWIRANPTKRKTAGGLPAFLHRWLSKAQDAAGSTRLVVGSNGSASRQETPQEYAARLSAAGS